MAFVAIGALKAKSSICWSSKVKTSAGDVSIRCLHEALSCHGHWILVFEVLVPLHLTLKRQEENASENVVC